MFDSHVPYSSGSAPSRSGNHQPWAAMTIQGGTTGVTFAFSFALPCQFSTHTHSPLPMPCARAVSGWISTTGSGSNCRSHGIWRCSGVKEDR